MTGDQFRAARALLNLSTRDLGKALDCSAMAISKLEHGTLKGTATLWTKAFLFYSDRGLAFYCGGVVKVDPSVAGFIEPLRNRLMDGEAGSAYVLAFDKLVEFANRNRA
jgi:transcriptional regulator with XRE-family HTH domain